MSNINKTAVFNPFPELTANILDYVPRATPSTFGIVALGSGINVDALGRIYLDTQEYANRLAAIEDQAASVLATQKSEVAAAIAQVTDMAPQATTYTKTEVDTAFAAYVGGRKAYTTLALAQADQTNLPANTAIEVTNDPTSANNGTYQWNGTTLTKSAYDPVTQAKGYTNQKVSELSSNIKDIVDIIDDPFAPTWLASVTVDKNGLIVKYTKTNGESIDEIQTAKMQEISNEVDKIEDLSVAINKINGIVYTFTDEYLPSWLMSVEIDKNGDIISYVRSSGKRVDSTTSESDGHTISGGTINKLKDLIIYSRNIERKKLDAVDIPVFNSHAQVVPTGLSKEWNIVTNPEYFTVRGGYLTYNTTVASAIHAQIQSRPSDFGGINRGRYEFMTDAPYLAIHSAVGSAVHFYVLVDDVYVGYQSNQNGYHYYWTLQFGSRKVRKISLIPTPQNANGLIGVQTTAIDRVFAVTDFYDAKVTFNGDSFCEGAGGNYKPDGTLDYSPFQTYFQILTHELGFVSAPNLAMGGTGLLGNRSGAGLTYRQRLSETVYYNPDLIIFNLTVNDSVFDTNALAVEMTEYLKALRAALPNAYIICTGICPASLGVTQWVLDYENECASAMNAFDDARMAFIRAATDTTPWIFGTGYAVGPNGTGNSDLYIGWSGGNDRTHPNAEGYRYIAARMKQKIIQQIEKWS